MECLCNLTANEMFDETGCCREVGEKLLKDVERLSQRCEHLIVVTNEVGADGGAYDAGTMAYIRTLGQLNRALARRFDCVCELVCGIPLVRKGALP